MHQKIDAAFCGQPFLQELSPTCPANRRRFNTYFREHKQVPSFWVTPSRVSITRSMKRGGRLDPRINRGHEPGGTCRKPFGKYPTRTQPRAPGLCLGRAGRLRRKQPKEHRLRRLTSADPAVLPPTRIGRQRNAARVP